MSTVSEASKSRNQDHVIDTALPDALRDLLRLNASFLTALSLHFAHNGVFTPVELGQLTPTIQISWGKRRVEIDDLRQILGVLQLETPEPPTAIGTRAAALALSNYGHGKVCVEARDDGIEDFCSGGTINEVALNDLFLRNISYLWHDFRRSCRSASQHERRQSELAADTEEFGFIHTAIVGEFMTALPMAPVTDALSLQHLENSRSSVQKRRQEFQTVPKGKKLMLEVNPDRPAKGSADRKRNLLARIRAKEVLAAKAPAGPTQSELQRKSSLEKIMAIVPLVTHLSNATENQARQSTGPKGSQRTSIPLPNLLQHLQGSLRNPISREEGELCIRLLAQEVAPEWIELVTMGTVIVVVVKKRNRPTDSVINERVRQRI
ncbi:MAG: hypothetical protein M1817_003437 [Caeruleum heppii]|nr:MAG: hypothetical protein M1817_003437 [Caeruleum heppii]